MAEFEVKKLSCRVKRTVKLYESVYDSDPCSTTIPMGTTFTSTKQYISDRISFAHITRDSEFCGLWCPISALQTKILPKDEKPAEDESGLSVVSLKLTIKGSKATVYSSTHASSPEASTFRVGDTVEVDRKTTVTVNGQEMTRYRIVSTTAEDQTVIGLWINLDENVENPNNYGAKRSIRATKNTMENTRAVISAPKAVSTSNSNTGTSTGTIIINGVKYSTSYPVTYTTKTNGAVTGVTTNQTGALASRVKGYIQNYISEKGTTFGGGVMGRMLFVHGMPFQYTYLTDRRLGATSYFGKTGTDDTIGDTYVSGNAYGRSFAREIAYNIPIASVIAGDPLYFQPVKESAIGTGIVNALTGGGSARDQSAQIMGNLFGASDGALTLAQEVLDDNGGTYNYFTFDVNTVGYFNHVNSLCRAAAVMLGIHNVEYSNQRCGTFHWGEYNQNAQEKFHYMETQIGLGNEVSFAFDPQGSISNTVQNQTQESMLSSSFNQISSTAREISFLAGITGSGMSWVEKNTDEATAKLVNNGGVIPDGLENAVERVKAWGINSAKGMNIRFPEIWADSNHAPSYEMEMHFISPYATPFCIWRYVLVPFYHVFVYAAPRSLTNASQYSSPYLIRASSKGYFNVEMGMVDSITWKRFGDGDMITEGGVPTQIDVTVTFKDLYHTLSLSMIQGSDGLLGAMIPANLGGFVNNSGLMDMIGTMTGINMNQLSIEKRFQLLQTTVQGIPNDIRGAFKGTMADYVRGVLDKVGIYKFS